jgi:hypothetical protein
MTLTSKFYDILKSIAMIYLPAATTLYFAVASIWGIPDTANVIGTMTAVDAFLGAILGISSKGYTPPTSGTLTVDGSGLKAAAINLTAEEVAAKPTITLQVKKDTSGSTA